MCKGTVFVVRDTEKARRELATVLPPASADKLLDRVAGGFAPGTLFDLLEEVQAAIPDRQTFLGTFLAACEKVEDAEFGEGYWIDHWFYLLDQIENYLAIYPEKKAELLCGRRDYTWFDSAMRVLDRNEKHVLCNDGIVRQVDAVARDDRKAARIAARATLPNLMRDAAGNVYTSTLLQKLAAIVITRLASFSPSGLGLDMEAGRPGWHDSINGLPGIFGSSTSEQFQLQRLIEFLLQSLGEVIERNGPLLNLPEELDGLRNSVAAALTAYEHDGDSVRDFNCWDRTTSAKEQYRARVRDGFSGTEVDIALSELEKFLANGLTHVRRALVRAVDERSGLPLTYYRHDPEAWEPMRGEDNKARRHPLGTPVRVTAFKVRPLPLFPEGILHSMRTQAENPEAGRVVCELEPRLPPWMFTTDSTVHHRIREDGTPEEIELPAGSCAALFLGRCLVIYENPARKATFGLNPVRVTGYNLLYSDGREYMAKGPVLNPEHAAALRSGMVSRLHVPLK